MKIDKKVWAGAAAVILVIGTVIGCASDSTQVTDPRNPTVVTLWHSYNAYAKDVFDDAVMSFNDTVGLEKGIVVDTYGYGSSGDLNGALYDSANEVIGSELLPDMAVIYPDSACRIDYLAPLVKLDSYFSDKELDLYQPEFLQEGIWGEDGSPRMIPAAKSTELLYLNETDWAVFSEETGISEALLSTWEGLSQAAGAYYEWSGGSALLGFNSFNDFAVMAAAQLDVNLYVNQDGKQQFRFPQELAQRMWDAYYVPHIKGWYQSEIYNQDGIKSGRTIAYIGSSAGAGYFPKEVIVDEQHGYPIECRVLPYPYFEGGNAYMTQRGANMCIFSSDQAHEYAASEFMKWFTEPEQNVQFSISTGYLPVERKALASVPDLLMHVKEDENKEAVKKSVVAALEQMNRGALHARKTYKGAYETNSAFGEAMAKKTALDLETLRVRMEHGQERDEVVSELLDRSNFEEWYVALCNGNGWLME